MKRIKRELLENLYAYIFIISFAINACMGFVLLMLTDPNTKTLLFYGLFFASNTVFISTSTCYGISTRQIGNRIKSDLEKTWIPKVAVLSFFTSLGIAMIYNVVSTQTLEMKNIITIIFMALTLFGLVPVVGIVKLLHKHQIYC